MLVYYNGDIITWSNIIFFPPNNIAKHDHLHGAKQQSLAHTLVLGYRETTNIKETFLLN
jgi:hypothetical protein